MTIEKKRRIITSAKVFLMDYFNDGEVYQPGDMEQDILGIFDVAGCLTPEGPAWNRSVFWKALGELVDEGRIVFTIAPDGQYYYTTTETSYTL